MLGYGELWGVVSCLFFALETWRFQVLGLGENRTLPASHGASDTEVPHATLPGLLQWFFVEFDPACFRRRVVLHVEYSFTMSSSSSSYSGPKFGGRGEEGTRGLLLQGPGAASPLRLVVPLSTELQVTFTTTTQCCYCFRAFT